MLKVSQILVTVRWLRFALVVSGVAVLAGCGQKGRLFLPTGEAAAERATLPQILSPAASAPPATGTPTPAPRP